GGLRAASAAERNHACRRAGAGDRAWEQGRWDPERPNPFGILEAGEEKGARAAAPTGLAEVQASALEELASELEAASPAVPAGALVRTGLGTTEPPEDRVTALAFSPDGVLLATGGRRGSVRIWDAATGRQRAAYDAAAGAREVQGLGFAPGGRALVVAA